MRGESGGAGGDVEREGRWWCVIELWSVTFVKFVYWCHICLYLLCLVA